MGSLSLLQGIFLTQELNGGFLHCRQSLYQLSYQGSPWFSDSHAVRRLWVFIHTFLLLGLCCPVSYESFKTQHITSATKLSLSPRCDLTSPMFGCHGFVDLCHSPL